MLLDQHVKEGDGQKGEPAFSDPGLYLKDKESATTEPAGHVATKLDESGKKQSIKRRAEQEAAFQVLKRQAGSLKTHPADIQDARQHIRHRAQQRQLQYSEQQAASPQMVVDRQQAEWIFPHRESLEGEEAT